jgi:DNA-binding PadR family transcriptional regulator
MDNEMENSEKSPLTEATYFILLSLSDKPKHGYAIMKDVQNLSDARVMLSTGTLYGALKRLLEQGWIERVEEEPVPNSPEETGRIRKAYALTTFGRNILKTEISRLKVLIDAAQLRTTGAQV